MKMSEKQYIKARHVLMFLVLILLLHLVLYMMGGVKFKVSAKQRPVLLPTYSKSERTVYDFPSLLDVMLEQTKAHYQTKRIFHLRAVYTTRNFYLRKWLIVQMKGSNMSNYPVYR